MTWFNTFANDEQLAVEDLQRKGITGKPTQPEKQVGLFESTVATVASPIRGTGIAFVKTADMLAKPLDLAGDAACYAFDYLTSDSDMPSFSQYREKAVQSRDNLVYGEILPYLENRVS